MKRYPSDVKGSNLMLTRLTPVATLVLLYIWTQTSWQVTQRLLIAVNHVGLNQWWANCDSPTYFLWLF